MPRTLTVAAAQSGPVSRSESRADVVERLLSQMREASRLGCDLVVFTEVALTAFFPHWYMDDQDEIDTWFEREMPGPETQKLFDEAVRLGIGFHLGYAELTREEGRAGRYNTSILVGNDGRIIRQVPEDPPARKRRVPTRGPISEPGEVLLRPGQPGVSNLAGLRRGGGVCAPATIAAGPRPTGCWRCAAQS